MPPKFKFSKEEIIAAAAEIVRESGMEALTARSLAGRLGCSPKPIFVSFSGMDEVTNRVIASADERYQSYLATDMKAGKYPPYKASGMAYIRFAREEKQLFRLLFMRDRTEEGAQEEDRESIRPLLELIMSDLQVNEDRAYLFHLELWIFVHGLASMIATSYLEWDESFISQSLTDIYLGLKHRFTEEKDERH